MSSTSFLLKIKLALGLGLGILLMATVGVASYFTISRLIEAAQAENKTEDAMVLLERANSSIKSNEAELRQYLLTGQAVDLKKIEQVRRVMRDAINQMRNAGSLPEQRELDELMGERRIQAEQAIALRQSHGQQGAAAILNSDLNRQRRQRTDSLLYTARNREHLSWQSSQIAAQGSAKWAQRLIVISGLLFLAMLAWAFYVVKHHEAARNRAQSQLRDSERRVRTLLDNLDEGIASISETGIVELFNPAAERMFGYGSEEVVGKNISMLMPGPYRSEHDGYMARFRHTGKAHIIGVGREITAQRSDGSIFPMDLRISEFFLEGRRQFIGGMRDITESKRITEALRASETQMRQITDTVPALIACLDKNQRFSFHNKAYEEVFGLAAGQIKGQTLAEVLGEPAYAAIKDKVEEVLRGYPVRYEREQMTPDGGRKSYAMQYMPRYGEGADEGKVVGLFSLGTDITELKRIDRMKTEFVSTVSHELRTPLTSIRGSLGLISGGVAGEIPEAVKNLVGIAKSNCERLIRLINDMLDSEKIESGKMRLDLQVVDIRPLIQQTLAANEGFAGQHRVKLQMLAPDEALKVRIDSDRMTQVLTNLLSNAAKFSPPDSTVEVRLSRVARCVRVEVVDHGPGIPDEFRSRIFKKFSQADSSDTRQKGGSGLGLNISRALIEQMNGAIGFTSQTGVGTTFFFELPEFSEKTSLPSLPSTLRQRTTAARPRILVCEGDPDVGRLIGMMLDKAGFEADMAQTAAQAMTCFAQGRYDAVTVDYTLPDQSAAAFISALRSNGKTRDVPVVVISALAEAGQLHFRHKPLAISGWLGKPIDENQLILSVHSALTGLKSGKPRVLHVEDDLDIQRVTAAIVEDLADFEFAATLEQARALLYEHRFDLVLLDLSLGEESGWELFEDIDALIPRPPVIVFSASDVDPGEGRQADAVLVKSETSNAQLLNTIQRVLQISGDPGPTRPPELNCIELS
ncbi:MAG: PAS domain S-box protein [Polaromonas sp.]